MGRPTSRVKTTRSVLLRNSTEAIWCVEIDPPLPLGLSEEEQMDHLYQHGRLVEAHSGRIWAENQSEGGAVIGFDLPVGKKG